MPTAPVSWRRRLRRQLRRRGTALSRACFLLAALIAAVVIAAFLNGRGGAPAGPADANAQPPSVTGPPAPTQTTPAIVTNAAAATSVPARLPTPTTARPVARPPLRDNTAPVFIGPTRFAVEREGETPVAGIGLRDAEAAGYPTEDVGVLLYSPLGRLRIGDVSGVRLYTENATSWIPITGPIDAVNRALGSLSYLPEPSRATHTIWMLASDFGHGDRSRQLTVQRTIDVAVAG